MPEDYKASVREKNENAFKYIKLKATTVLNKRNRRNANAKLISPHFWCSAIAPILAVYFVCSLLLT